MKFENTEVWGFKHALRGMRNPKNSWHLSDSYIDEIGKYVIGEKDLKLAQMLIKGGSEHRKFLRQIFVSVDISAPLFWWKEFDTYKIGTTANSTSTMHKITSKPIAKFDFEIDDFTNIVVDGKNLETLINTQINILERLRQKYIFLIECSKDNRISKSQKDAFLLNAKIIWKELIRWLPESWLQTRTVTLNYENLLSICNQRKNHKLNEWSGKEDNSKENFIKWVSSLPYANELIFYGEAQNDKN